MGVDALTQGDARIVILSGDVSMRESLEFARELKDACSGQSRVIIVAFRCSMINSHCLGTVLAAYNTLKSSPKMLKIVSESKLVSKSLMNFRIVPLVPLFDTIQEALEMDEPEKSDQ